MLVAALVATVMLMGGCGGRDVPDEPDVELPATWSDLSAKGPSVEFREDGTGTLTRFPLWTGGTCDAEHSVPYSGEVRWTGVDGYIQVEAPNGPIAFHPDAQFMSDNWSKLVIRRCGEDTPDSQLLVYGGGPGY